MKRLLASLILLAGLAPTEALACLCNPGETGRPLEKSEVAFVGRPIRIEVVPAAPTSKTTWQALKDSFSTIFGASPAAPERAFPKFLDSVRVTFEVSEYLKGGGPKQFQVMTGYGDSDCGLPVSVSKRYQIYARRIDGALRTSYCFGSAEHVRRRNPQVCAGS